MVAATYMTKYKHGDWMMRANQALILLQGGKACFPRREWEYNYTGFHLDMKERGKLPMSTYKLLP